jgi:hypothetical protein
MLDDVKYGYRFQMRDLEDVKPVPSGKSSLGQT